MNSNNLDIRDVTIHLSSSIKPDMYTNTTLLDRGKRRAFYFATTFRMMNIQDPSDKNIRDHLIFGAIVFF